MARAFLSLGVLISGFMISAAAPPTAAPGGKLAPFTETLPASVVKVQMIPVPGGTVKIGTQMVTVKPFWMARTETPWEAFDVFTASGPPSPPYGQTQIAPDAVARPSKSYILPDLGWGHNGYPVINVSFLNSQMFCRWLAGATGKKYRLPTEAEWEYACRAGQQGPWKIDKPTLEKSAWYAANSESTTHPVGKKQPNAWGLYDMLGNTGEWATDMDGKPVLCGGTFLDPAAQITPATRKRWTPAWQETDPQYPKSRWWLADGKFVGFRLVCEP
jgi:formylglycine-generating enzyme required for sulfatase activity